MAQLSAVANVAVPTVPVGSLQAYAGANAPYGWLLCDGSAVSRTTYSNLYSTIGTTFGSGDGSTTFNVPDMRGRHPIGAGTGAQNGGTGTGAISGGTALTARSLGAFGGDERLQSHKHYSPGQRLSTLYTAGGSPLQGWNSPGIDALSDLTSDHNQSVGSGGNMSPYVVTNYIIKALSDTPRNGLYANPAVPIVTSLPTNPAFNDQIIYYSSGAYQPYTYTGASWQPTNGPLICTSTTRPSSPYPGQMIYETDSGRNNQWNGSAWISPISAIMANVVSTHFTSTFTFPNVSSTYQNATGLAATITPTLSTSKVLVTAVVHVSTTSSGPTLFNGRVTRNGTALPFVSSATIPNTGGSYNWALLQLSYLDSPATTSAMSYQFQVANTNGATNTYYVNYRGDGGAINSTSSITVQEIPA